MSLTLRLTGTGGARWCRSSLRLRGLPRSPRGKSPPPPCSGVVTFNSAVTLLDAGRPDLMEHHPGSFQQVLLTHHHLDHVQGCFRCAESARRFRSMAPDDAGCDDLLKHPVCLTLPYRHAVCMFNLQGCG